MKESVYKWHTKKMCQVLIFMEQIRFQVVDRNLMKRISLFLVLIFISVFLLLLLIGNRVFANCSGVLEKSTLEVFQCQMSIGVF